MIVPLYTYPNDGYRLLELPDADNNDILFLGILDDTDDPLVDDNSLLSVDERMALLDELADKFMEFAGPDVQPLSNYAVSRESIYEDHL